MQPSAPPGWYADPWLPHQVRWFDGVQWTPHAAPAQQGAADAGPDSALHWMLPVGRSWQSITAGYVGLFAVVIVFLGPVALGLGTWGLVVARRRDGHGTGRSVFAMVAGLWGTLATLYLLGNG
jgi:hypothetical protein